MIRRIWAFLTRGECVVLKSYDGTLYYTIAHTDPWGEKWAHVYWYLKIGSVRLWEHGGTSGPSSYIKQWMKG